MVLYMYMRSISRVCVNDLEYAGIMIFNTTQTKMMKDAVIVCVKTVTLILLHYYSSSQLLNIFDTIK